MRRTSSMCAPHGHVRSNTIQDHRHEPRRHFAMLWARPSGPAPNCNALPTGRHRHDQVCLGSLFTRSTPRRPLNNSGLCVLKCNNEFTKVPVQCTEDAARGHRSTYLLRNLWVLCIVYMLRADCNVAPHENVISKVPGHIAPKTRLGATAEPFQGIFCPQSVGTGFTGSERGSCPFCGTFW